MRLSRLRAPAEAWGSQQVHTSPCDHKQACCRPWQLQSSLLEERIRGTSRDRQGMKRIGSSMDSPDRSLCNHHTPMRRPWDTGCLNGPPEHMREMRGLLSQAMPCSLQWLINFRYHTFPSPQNCKLPSIGPGQLLTLVPQGELSTKLLSTPTCSGVHALP